MISFPTVTTFEGELSSLTVHVTFLYFVQKINRPYSKQTQCHPLLLYGKSVFLVGGYVFKNQIPEQKNIERSIFARSN